MTDPNATETKLQLAAIGLRRGDYTTYAEQCRLAVLLEEALAAMAAHAEDHKRWHAAAQLAVREALT